MAAGRIPTTANSPITAKGDLFTFSTAPARLAVGSDGEQIVADSSTSTGLRYVSPLATLSNPIINGGQDIAQRGTSFTTTSTAQYTLDRFTSRTGSVGGSFVTTQQATGDTTNLPNIQYCVRNRRATSNTNTGSLEYYQAVETINSIPYAGKTATFSFYARKGANFSGTFSATLKSGTGTDEAFVPAFTGNTVVGISSPTLTTTWTRYSVSGTFASTITQIGVIFTHSPSGTAASDDYYEVTGVQIDLGTFNVVATPTFRRNGASIQGELDACSRYYYRQTSSQLYSIFASAIAENGTTAYTYTAFPVTMRVAPTSIDYSTVGIGNSYNILTAVTPALQTNTQSPYAGAVKCTGGSGLTAGNAYYLTANNSATAYIAFNAEL